MSYRMSCSMTVDAVKARTKTVTRRHIDTWKNLKPGDRLTLIEKGMGLAKGERQVVLAEVDVVNVRIEPITAITDDDLVSEGFADMFTDEFVSFWLNGHGYTSVSRHADAEQILCRRIEWRYLEDGAS